MSHLFHTRALSFTAATALVSTLLVAAMPVEEPEDRVLAEGVFDVEASEPAPSEGRLFAWPANEALATLEVGEKFTMDPVAEVDVASDGSFDVKIAGAEDLRDYASDRGEVNLYLSADNGLTEFSESFTIDVSAVESSDVDSPVVDLGAVEPASGLEATSPVDATTAPAYMEKSCTSTKIRDLGNRWVPIGGLFSTNAGATVDFEYASGQSSQLEVGTSQKASNVGFKVNGTNSMSSTATINYPKMSGKGSKLARTQFRYGNYENRCTVFHTSGIYFTTTTYTVRPDLWAGGTNFIATSAPTATNCAPYLKGSTFTKDNHKQVTWSGAVSLYDVSLSAQTGWSSKGKLVAHFANAAGKVCGANGYPTASNAYQIVVK